MNWVCSPSIFGSYPTRCRHNKFTTTCWWVTCRCFTRGLCLSSIGIALRTLTLGAVIALCGLVTVRSLSALFFFFFFFLLIILLLCDFIFIFFIFSLLLF